MNLIQANNNGCLAKDVNLMLDSKVEKKACDILIGERLLGLDGRSIMVCNIINGHEAELFVIKCVDGNEIKLTGNNPLLCEEQQCKRACEIQVGDKLQRYDNICIEVESVKQIPYNNTVYNFIVNEYQNEGAYLIANGFVVGDFIMQNTKGSFQS